MTRPGRYPQEQRAVRLVLEHQDEHPSQWAAVTSIAPKVGRSAETLPKGVRRAETDEGLRPGLASEERERLKTLEREVRELRRANEILKSAAAFFGAEPTARGWDREVEGHQVRRQRLLQLLEQLGRPKPADAIRTGRPGARLRTLTGAT
jgi:transposase